MKKRCKIVLGLSIVVLISLVFMRFILVKTNEIVVYSNNTKLVGTIATPRFQSGPYPVLIVVQGSGADTRNTLAGFRRLTNKGYGVITYDKRGVGESEGTYSKMTFKDGDELMKILAKDVNAIVDFASNRNEIDATNIGLIGNSQAGWIMPIAANQNTKISYFICISGPAVTFGVEEYFSQLTGDDPGFYFGLSDDEIEKRLNQYSGSTGYDPRPELNKLKIPSFWILGGKDRSVPTKYTIEEIHNLSNKNLFDIKVFPKGNHSIMNSDDGNRINYWNDIYNWLEELHNND